MEHRNQNRPYKFTLKRRLWAAAIGAIIVLFGVVRQLSGVTVVTHWTGQPMYSFGLIAAGGLMILIALVPSSWLDKVFQNKIPKP